MILIVTLSPRLAVVDGSLPLGGPPIRFGVADACGPGLADGVPAGSGVGLEVGEDDGDGDAAPEVGDGDAPEVADAAVSARPGLVLVARTIVVVPRATITTISTQVPGWAIQRRRRGGTGIALARTSVDGGVVLAGGPLAPGAAGRCSPSISPDGAG